MITALILGIGITAAHPGTSAADLAAYEAARVTVGRAPDAHVRLALWCEAHGLQAERIRHLAIAVLSDPKNAAARGLMGLVAYRGRWERPEEVGRRVKADAALAAVMAEYNARRDRTPQTADAQWRLALWCGRHGLKAEEQAHLSTVVRLDPGREDAWKRLGCKKHGGRWLSEAQIREERAEAEARRLANTHWVPLLTRWRVALNDKGKRDDAESELARLTDPAAVPAVWTVFAARGPEQQTKAVQLFGQIDAPTASRALAMLAAFGRSPTVRRAAAETLRRRDPRDVVDLLIDQLREPIKYRVRPVTGPGSQGALFVEGKRFDVQRLYTAPGMPEDTAAGLRVIQNYWNMRMLGQIASSNASPGPAAIGQPTSAATALDGLGGGSAPRNPADFARFQAAARESVRIQHNLDEAQKAALGAQQQLAADVDAIESFNRSVARTNVLIEPILNDLTGQDLGQNPDSWKAWWTDQQGYVYDPATPTTKPVLTDQVAPLYTPTYVARPTHSCFGAGTLVTTLDGTKPIESIRVGDRILTQDVETATLDYKPVLAVFHNKPSATLRVTLDGKAIVVTGIHRFWKAGRGWVMARDLKAGDVLRTVGGTARVESIEAGGVQPVFNLEVADHPDFFVGDLGALVHDNSLVQPVASPFDAAPSLAGAPAAPTSPGD